MAFIQKSCYCLKLRTGTITVGVISLLIFIILGIGGPIAINKGIDFIKAKVSSMAQGMIKGTGKDTGGKVPGLGNEAEKKMNEMIDKLLGPVLPVINGVKTGLIVVSSIMMVVSVILIVGVIMNKKWLMAPFIVMQPIFLIVLVVALITIVKKVTVLLKQDPSTFYYIVAAIVVPIALLQLYFIMILVGYYLEEPET